MNGLEYFISFIFDNPSSARYMVAAELVLVEENKVKRAKKGFIVEKGDTFEGKLKGFVRDLGTEVIGYSFTGAGYSRESNIPVVNVMVRIGSPASDKVFFEVPIESWLPFPTEMLSYLYDKRYDKKEVPLMIRTRFKNKEEAVSFVKNLYDKGAIEVKIRIKFVKGQREFNPNDEVNEVEILLPRDKEKRKNIIELTEEENNKDPEYYLEQPMSEEYLDDGPGRVWINWK